ncbi:hypothetical protein BKA70DRAFT_833802 [Coprinopsis sp. MPI-PUGE-AT-0042]|nr:hypothetical protein BKA70DRAFT_833802 [Coprinopsis sp. MPI-PUGE-AT-0042]
MPIIYSPSKNHTKDGELSNYSPSLIPKQNPAMTSPYQPAVVLPPIAGSNYPNQGCHDGTWCFNTCISSRLNVSTAARVDISTTARQHDGSAHGIVHALLLVQPLWFQPSSTPANHCHAAQRTWSNAPAIDGHANIPPSFASTTYLSNGHCRAHGHGSTHGQCSTNDGCTRLCSTTHVCGVPFVRPGLCEPRTDFCDYRIEWTSTWTSSSWAPSRSPPSPPPPPWSALWSMKLSIGIEGGGSWACWTFDLAYQITSKPFKHSDSIFVHIVSLSIALLFVIFL